MNAVRSDFPHFGTNNGSGFTHGAAGGPAVGTSRQGKSPGHENDAALSDGKLLQSQRSWILGCDTGDGPSRARAGCALRQATTLLGPIHCSLPRYTSKSREQ